MTNNWNYHEISGQAQYDQLCDDGERYDRETERVWEMVAARPLGEVVDNLPSSIQEKALEVFDRYVDWILAHRDDSPEALRARGLL
jgi:hypothetical protein